MIDFGIIAAGDGNRIKEEGSSLPKPLVEIEGMPMIGRLIKIMQGSGAASISVIVNSDMPDVIDYVNYLKSQTGCPLKILDKKTESSMHTFYELVKLMQPEDRFVVTTVDTIFRQQDFNRYVEKLKNSSRDRDGVMGVTDFIDDEKPLYVEVDREGKITGYKDLPETGIKYVSAGIYGLNRKSLPILQNCIETGVKRMRNFQRALVDAGLNIYAFNLGKVVDVDHMEDIAKANEFLKNISD